MKISNRIIEVLEYLSEKLGIAVDWTSNNTIPYLQQLCEKYITYCIVIDITWFIIGLIVTYCGGRFFAYIRTHKEFGCISPYDDDNAMTRCVLYVLSAVAFITGIAVVLNDVFSLIECITFPEKVIYDFILNEKNITAFNQ